MRIYFLLALFALFLLNNCGRTPEVVPAELQATIDPMDLVQTRSTSSLEEVTHECNAVYL